MSVPDISVYDNDPTLYLVTSLTAGSSHIITATSRMETILRANKIPFVGVDTATDGRMRSLWSRRARGKKFPGLVREGFLIGDLEQIEEWNEFGELHENIPTIGKAPAAPAAAPKAAPAEPPVSIPTNAKQKVENKPPAPAASGPPQTLAMRQMVQEAAAKAKDFKAGKDKEDNGPATPIKLGRIDHSKPKLPPSDLKSPKFIPIPDSPGIKSPVSPVTESGVGMSIEERAGKPKQTHRGSSVNVASQEDIKKIEDEQKIDEEDEEESDEEEEEDSSEEEDEDEESQDEKVKDIKKKDDAEDDEDDDDEDEDSSEDEAPQPSKTTTTTSTTKPPTTTPASPTATTTAAATTSQPAASAAHAGQSVGD